jgi:hypothetical protein
MIKEMRNLTTIVFVALLTIFLILNVSAYNYKLSICNSTLNDSCINITDSTGTTGVPAVVFYKDGAFYITNEINATVSPNITYYYNVTNVTQYTTTVTNYTYTTQVINLSNGSTFSINITINDSMVQSAIQGYYNNTNSYYTKADADTRFASLSDYNNYKGAVGASYVPITRIQVLEDKFGIINSINWTGFNLTAINNHIDGGGDFNMTWKIVVVVEGVIIVLLLLVFGRQMMSGGGDY